MSKQIKPGDIFKVVIADWHAVEKGDYILVMSREDDVYPVAVLNSKHPYTGISYYENSLQASDINKHEYLFNLYDIPKINCV